MTVRDDLCQEIRSLAARLVLMMDGSVSDWQEILTCGERLYSRCEDLADELLPQEVRDELGAMTVHFVTDGHSFTPLVIKPPKIQKKAN